MNDTQDVEVFLSHFGIKGQKWGVRRNRTPGVGSKVDKDAAKDAHEFARAKSFFGEGAGTRRKLIKSKVEYKSKNVPGYKQAFDNHSTRQNLSTHADKAVRERSRTDRRTRNKQRRGAIARRVTGEMGTQAAFVALTAGGLAFANSSRGRALMQRGMNTVRNANNERLRRAGAKKVQDLLNSLS